MEHCGDIFRKLHELPGAFVMPNPWDVGSARVLAGLGFRALATTSAGMAFALGLPDGAVSRETTLKHCRELVSATSLPVSADLEKGFGDTPESVFETIKAAAATGLAGCSIEDHTGNKDAPIYDASLASDRIQAAKQACDELSEDFVLTARCENLLWGMPELDDVINRLQSYEKVGADVLYAPGLHDLATIREVCSATTKPINVVMGMQGAKFGVDELKAVGVKRISVGPAFARIAYGGLVEAAKEIIQKGTFQFSDDAIGFADLEAYFESYRKA